MSTLFVDPKDPESTERFYFDYAGRIPSNDVIISAEVNIKSGTATTPLAPNEISGQIVGQLLAGGIAGETVVLECKADTDSGLKKIPLTMTIPIIDL